MYHDQLWSPTEGVWPRMNMRMKVEPRYICLVGKEGPAMQLHTLRFFFGGPEGVGDVWGAISIFSAPASISPCCLLERRKSLSEDSWALSLDSSFAISNIWMNRASMPSNAVWSISRPASAL